MKEILGIWQGMIGEERIVKVAEILYGHKVNLEFNNHFVYKGTNSIVFQLKSVGGLLLGLDFLTEFEKSEMILTLAEYLISKSLSIEFVKSLSEILELEFEEESWLDNEISEIKRLLDNIEKEKRFE